MNVFVGWLRLIMCGVVLWSTTSVCLAQDNADLLKLVVDLLGEKDKAMRAVAYEQIRSVKGEAATKQFAAQLAKIAPEAQVGLLSALGDRGDAAAKPAVLELLTKSTAADVREAALLALGKLGDANETAILLTALESKVATENAAAVASLSRLKGATVNDALIDAIKKASPTTSATLIKILATRHADEAIPQLLVSAVHDNAEVRAAAMASLAEMAEVNSIPGLLRGVLKAEDGEERDAAERAVVAVCAKNPTVDERVQPILKELGKFNETEQVKLLSVVARVGGSPAYQLVETSMKSSDAARSSAAWKALGKWPDASIAPKLLEFARTAKDAEQRTLSLKAYIRAAAMRDARSDKDRLDSVKLALPLATNDEEKNLVIARARTAYTVETLRFALPFVDQPQSAQIACETIVELAHHRDVRDANKAEFDKALDLVMKVSTDPVVRERAKLYKNGQTWLKPSAPKKS